MGDRRLNCVSVAKESRPAHNIFIVSVHGQCASAVSQFLDRSYEGKGMFFYIFSRLVACGCQSRVENLFSLAGRLIRTAKGQGKMRGPQRPSLARRGGFFFKIHDPLFA